MISWLGKADQWMLKIRPSPGSQSTVITPLLIFQSFELLVSIVTCACVGEGASNRTSAIAERRRGFIGEASIFQKKRRSDCRFDFQPHPRLKNLVESIGKQFHENEN